MNLLKHILASYTEYIRAVLIPMGPWGILLIAFIDAAFLGIPMDPLVAYFVYRRPGMFWLYTLMGAAGSALIIRIRSLACTCWREVTPTLVVPPMR